MIVSSAQGGGGGLSEPLTLTQLLTLAGAGVSFSAFTLTNSSGVLVQNGTGGISAYKYASSGSGQAQFIGTTTQTTAATAGWTGKGYASNQANQAGCELGLGNVWSGASLVSEVLCRWGHSFDTTPVYPLQLMGNGKLAFSATNNGGTTGAQTINTPTGIVGIAAGQSSVVITNSACNATSVVLPVLQTVDATMTSVVVVPAAGSFTITGNAVCTGAVKVGFVVLN